MKVFISHAFGGDDERFGNTLKEDLAAAGIDGYMAKKTPQYNLLIADKIRRAIDESKWLVAIITERGQASASVHEEIGYALGKDVEVVLMLKKDIEESGVLVHGREPLVFTPGEFKRHSLEAVEFIKNAPAPRPRSSFSKEAMRLLAVRNVASASSPLFAQNEHFARLHSPILNDAEKPVALFTACPHQLADGVDVASEEFVEWSKSTTCIEVDGQQIGVPGFDHYVDIGTLYAAKKYASAPRNRNILMYRELQSNGLCELGTSHVFFGRNDEGRMMIHLCYMIGEFWSFLAYARHFYKKIGLDAPLTALLSLRNSHKLVLGNFGDEVLSANPSVRVQLQFERDYPATHHKNIRLEYTFGPAGKMTNEAIAAAAKKAAKDICNAYGKTTPRCYGADGKFSWELWNIVSKGAIRGGRL